MKLIKTLLTEGIEYVEEKYSIKTRRHETYPNLVLFKYNQLDSPMEAQIVQESRGIILDEEDNWRVISRPFDKFFNYGEAYAADIDWSTAQVQEKLDGSCIQMYFYDNKWQVGTLGVPDASTPVHDTETLFSELFWTTFQKQRLVPPPSVHAGYTFIWELMSPWNRIVVRHEEPKLCLIGLRHLHDGQEYDPACMKNYFPTVPASYNLNSFDGLFSTFEDMQPLEQEGYVVVDKSFNRVKVKHPGYVALHHLKGSFSRRRVAQIVANTGEMEEILVAFPEWSEIMHHAKNNWDELITELEADYERIKHIERQKDFALEANKTRVPSAMFSVRKGTKGKQKINSVKEYMRTMHPAKLVKLLDLKKMKIPGVFEGENQ